MSSDPSAEPSTEQDFLNRATWGLGSAARAEAQAELRSHLHERTSQLMAAGLNQAEARAQALGELGPARTLARANLATRQVHPRLVLVAGLGALLSAGLGYLGARAGW